MILPSRSMFHSGSENKWGLHETNCSEAYNNEKHTVRSLVHITSTVRCAVGRVWRRRNLSGPPSPAEPHTEQHLETGKWDFYCCDFVVQVKMYIVFTQEFIQGSHLNSGKLADVWEGPITVTYCWWWWEVHVVCSALESSCHTPWASALTSASCGCFTFFVFFSRLYITG